MKIDVLKLLDIGKYTKLYDTFKKIWSIIVDVEQKAKDGKITPDERATIAIKDITEVLNSIGVKNTTEVQVGALVDIMVMIFNAVGIFTHKK